jgi:hypothetical protein
MNMGEEKAIDGLAAAVRELDLGVYEIGRGLGAIDLGDDVAADPPVLESINSSLLRIAGSLGELVGLIREKHLRENIREYRRRKGGKPCELLRSTLPKRAS